MNGTDIAGCEATDRVEGGWYPCGTMSVAAQTINALRRPLCDRHARQIDGRAVRYARTVVELRAELAALDPAGEDYDEDRRQITDEIEQVGYQIADLRCQ